MPGSSTGMTQTNMARHKQHHRDSAPGGSQRQLRVGELVRHAMAEMLTRGDVHDPVIEGHLITVPEVRMTADLRLATIYIMPLAGRDGGTPGGSQRQLRVGELVRHAIADMLTRGDVHDPVIEGHLITVPEVRMTPDLRLATIYIMPLAGRDTDKVIAAFERNKKFIRGEIAHAVNLKFAPDIRFHIDDRFEEAERIDKLLRSPEVKRDLDDEGEDDE